MSDTQFNIDDLVEGLYGQVPIHECEGIECEHPGAFIMFVTDQGPSIAISSATHKMSPDAIIQGFVQTVDRMMISNKRDGIPDSIAVAEGRETMRQMVEQIEVPGDVSQELHSFLDRLNEMFHQEKGEQGE